MKDYYRILQVHQEAEQEVISAAYRRLAQKYHPDNYTSSHDKHVAEEKMKEINEANEVLGDPEKRRVYNKNLCEDKNRKKASDSTSSPKTSKPGSERSSAQTDSGSSSSITTLNQLQQALLQTKFCGSLTPEMEDFRKAKLISQLSDEHFVYHLSHWAGGQHLYVTSKAKTFDSIVLSYYGAFFGRAEIFEILKKLPKPQPSSWVR